MNARLPTIQLVTRPVMDPGHEQRRVEVRADLTIAQLVDIALPGLPELALRRLRVTITTPKGGWIIPRENWRRTRAQPGTSVVLRLVPGRDYAGPILQVVVMIAAVALGQLWALPLSNALQISATAASTIITAGVALGGNLLISALIPSRKKDGGAKQHYTVDGFRNSLNPGGDVPFLLGEHRFAPPFYMTPYTTVIGDEQYAYLPLIVGLGAHAIRNIKIGDTPLAQFSDVEIEIREGLETDLPRTLITQQVIEERVGVVLTGPDKPETRSSPRDVTKLSVDLHFPSGMIWYKSDGSQRPWFIDIVIEQRLAGTDVWEMVTAPTIAGQTREPFFRCFEWEVAGRGQYEINVRRTSPESTQAQVADKCVWYALRGIRPESPINFDVPVATIDMRIKVTHQLNGGIDNVNCVAARLAPDWDHETGNWIWRETRNPASLALFVRRGPGAAKPKADAQFHWHQYEDWHDFCRLKGLHYDRVHDTAAPIREVEADVAAAGRASIHDDGRALGVVIDRPQTVVIDHLSEANSSNFRGEITYLDPPDGFRVPFNDRTRDYESAERIIPWPGHVGPVRLTEELQLRGKTDPAEVWIAARRHQYELLNRRESWTREQAGYLRQATRGDLVAMSHKLLASTSGAAHVRAVTGNYVVLDNEVEIVSGTTYGAQFTINETAESLGEVVTREISAEPGAVRAIRLVGPGPVPLVNRHIAIGKLSQITVPAIVRSVESAGRLRSRLTLVPAAPEIDQLTDLEVPPPWDGRVGAEVPVSEAVPPVPVIVRLVAGGAATGTAGRVVVQLVPASSPVPVVRFEAQHRLAGAGVWLGPANALAGAGAVQFGGYAAGNPVELQVRGISSAGIASPWSDTVSIVVGPDAEVIAPPVSLAAAPSGAAIVLTATAGDDESTYRMRFWQSVAGAAWTGTGGATEAGNRLCRASDTRAIVHSTLAGSWDYRVTTEDDDGNASAPFGPVTVTGGSNARGAGGSDMRGAGGSNIRGAGA